MPSPFRLQILFFLSCLAVLVLFVGTAESRRSPRPPPPPPPLQEQQNSSSSSKSWQWCVQHIGRFYRPTPDGKSLAWTDEGGSLCGFKTVTLATLHREAFFGAATRDFSAGGAIRHTFAGDSTALRAYGYAVNSFMPPRHVKIGKVRQSPPAMATALRADEGLAALKDDDKKSSSASLPVAEMRFSRLVHLSQWQASMDWVFERPVGRGLLSLSLGNWDLNWLIRHDYKIPGMRARKFWAALDYWTGFSTQLFDNLNSHLVEGRRKLTAATGGTKKKKKTDEGGGGLSTVSLPIIVVKEQLMPNCASPRFTDKKVKGKTFRKHCRNEVKPNIVPLYRRVVAAAAWARNIPVIPFDHLMSYSFHLCAAGDGIHLDDNCMQHEQQLIWNVYLLMLRRDVVQGNQNLMNVLRRKKKKALDEGTSAPSPVTTAAAAAAAASPAPRSRESLTSPGAVLTTREAANETMFNIWWCSRPWEPECDSTGKPVRPQIAPRDQKMTTEEPSSDSSSSSPSEKATSGSVIINAGVPSSSPLAPTTDVVVMPPQTPVFKPRASVTDVFTVVLMVAVPVVAYIGLRSVVSS